MAFTKPNVNTIWADTGDVIAPDSAKVAQGWIAEIPDFEFENWIQNRQDQFNAHINQYGIPVWDSTTEYQAGKSYVQGSDGDIYRAVTTNTNTNPVTNTPSDWQKAFDAFDSAYDKTESDNRYLRKTNNLSDVSNAATARTNLSIYSKTESDSRYLLETNNLSDLTDPAAARANLGILSSTDVYTKTESDDRYLNETNNLSDLTNVASARTNLGVYSKAQSDDNYVSAGSFRGMIAPFPSAVVPSGWLKCDGSAVSRSTYSDLFAYLGTAYGSGNGTTTFNLPDLRGEFLRGWDDGRGVDSGRNIGSLQLDSFESHSHTGSTNSAGAHTHNIDARGLNNGGAQVDKVNGDITDTVTTNSAGAHTHSLSINSTGGDETRPRNVALMYCIKT